MDTPLKNILVKKNNEIKNKLFQSLILKQVVQSNTNTIQTQQQTDDQDSLTLQILADLILYWNQNIKKKEDTSQTSLKDPPLNFSFIHNHDNNELNDVFLSTFFETIKIIQNQISTKESLIQDGNQNDQIKNEYLGYIMNSKKFVFQILKGFQESNIITQQQIILNLDESQIKDQTYLKIDQEKFKKFNNYFYYMKHVDQEKYNLLYEESEGFSKLIVILNQDIQISELEQIQLNIQQVVHRFNLEYLRVIDIILEFAEIKIAKFIESLSSTDIYLLSRQEITNIFKIHLQILQIFFQNSETSKNFITSLLGMKINHFLHTNENLLKPNKEQNLEEKQIIPYNLILLISLFIREDIVLMEDILPYFIIKKKEEIKDEEGNIIDEKFIEQVDDIKEYHLILEEIYNKKYQSLEVKILDQNFKKQQEQEFQNEKKKADSLKNNSIPYNFTLWLVICLIQINDFDDAEILINCLWGHQKIDVTINKDFIQSLNAYLDAIIPHLNDRNFTIFWQKRKQSIQKFISHNKGLLQFGQENPCEIMVLNLQKILQIQYYYIGQNPAIFQRLIETVNKYLIGTYQDNQDENIKQFGYLITGKYLLPALCISYDNVQNLENELWKILEKMKFQERYKYYQQLYSNYYISNTNMLKKFVDLYPRALQWTKKLSIEREQIEIMKNETIKIANGGNTLILANQIVKICSNYNNLNKSLILSMEKQAFGNMALDMVSYCIIKNLSDNQDSYQKLDSQVNPPLSFTYIIEFASIFYKSFPNVEISSLIQYILNRLVDGDHTYEVLILQNLIQALSGWKDLEVSQLNEKQLICLAGGIILKTDILGQYKQFKESYKSQKALYNIFYGEFNFQNQERDQGKNNLSLAFRLMVNLAKQSQRIVESLESDDINFIQNFFDKIHEIFIQIVDTIYFINQDQQKYKKLMPNYKDCSKIFITEYGGIPYHYAYQILRKSFKPFGEINDQEFQELSNCYTDIFDSYIQNQINISSQNYQNNNQEINDNWSEEENQIYFDESKYMIRKNENKWKNFNKDIFSIFWQLELQDIQSSTEMYEEQIKQKENQLQNLKKEENINKNKDSYQSDIERQSKQLRNEINLVTKQKEDLKSEQNKVQVKYQKSMQYLKQKLPPLFEQIQDEFGVSHFFIQYCIYPRLRMSPEDAIFSIKFLQILIDFKVQKINILNIFSQILRGIPAIYSCTYNESENLGVFFMELFKMIERWARNDEQGKLIWQNECACYSGFRKMMNQSEIVSQEHYREKIFEGVHKRVWQVLKNCFKNPIKQQMKTRCALKVLFRVRSVFPKDRIQANQILTEISELIRILETKKEYQDMWILAQRYHNDIDKQDFGIESRQTHSQTKENQKTQENKNQKNQKSSQEKDLKKEINQQNQQTLDSRKQVNQQTIDRKQNDQTNTQQTRRDHNDHHQDNKRDNRHCHESDYQESKNHQINDRQLIVEDKIKRESLKQSGNQNQQQSNIQDDNKQKLNQLGKRSLISQSNQNMHSSQQNIDNKDFKKNQVQDQSVDNQIQSKFQKQSNNQVPHLMTDQKIQQNYDNQQEQERFNNKRINKINLKESEQQQNILAKQQTALEKNFQAPIQKQTKENEIHKQDQNKQDEQNSNMKQSLQINVQDQIREKRDHTYQLNKESLIKIDEQKQKLEQQKTTENDHAFQRQAIKQNTNDNIKSQQIQGFQQQTMKKLDNYNQSISQDFENRQQDLIQKNIEKQKQQVIKNQLITKQEIMNEHIEKEIKQSQREIISKNKQIEFKDSSDFNKNLKYDNNQKYNYDNSQSKVTFKKERNETQHDQHRSNYQNDKQWKQQDNQNIQQFNPNQQLTIIKNSNKNSDYQYQKNDQDFHQRNQQSSHSNSRNYNSNQNNQNKGQQQKSGKMISKQSGQH